MSSPYINRFLQPDTIIPDLSDPQSWNRYSYALGNPTKYRDPSGHGVDCGIGMGCVSDYTAPSGESNGGGGDPSEEEVEQNLGLGDSNDLCRTFPWTCDIEGNPLIDILSSYVDGVDVMIESGCMGSPSSFLTTATCVDYASLLTQDLATLFSSAGASLTLITTLLGCAPSSGVGCAVGYGVGAGVHLLVFNTYESLFSGISFGLTTYSDVLTNDSYFNSLNDWYVGEDTRTGFFTWLGGTLLIEPFFDAAVDIYSSGYNHGYFCGISTILDCIP